MNQPNFPYYKLQSNPTRSRYLLIKNQHLTNPNPPGQTDPPENNTPRTKTTHGSENYHRSLRRAFARSKLLAYFNPDLTLFITLTYATNQTSHDQALYDLKQFFKKTKRHTKTKPKYLYVFEYQKRGAIHVHMIANDAFKLTQNKNGYDTLSDWQHGFSSVLRISQTDNNFKPYLYLFKYMHKSERIGSSFVHTSRNFDKIQHLDYREYIHKLEEANLLYKEDIEVYVNERPTRIIKEYYQTAPPDDTQTKARI